MSMFDRFVSSAKERVIDTVSATVRGTATAVGHISSLIGNPLSKDFDVKEHVASFGPNLGWKVYNAKKKTTGQVLNMCRDRMQSFSKFRLKFNSPPYGCKSQISSTYPSDERQSLTLTWFNINNPYQLCLLW